MLGRFVEKQPILTSKDYREYFSEVRFDFWDDLDYHVLENIFKRNDSEVKKRKMDFPARPAYGYKESSDDGKRNRLTAEIQNVEYGITKAEWEPIYDTREKQQAIKRLVDFSGRIKNEDTKDLSSQKNSLTLTLMDLQELALEWVPANEESPDGGLGAYLRFYGLLTDYVKQIESTDSAEVITGKMRSLTKIFLVAFKEAVGWTLHVPTNDDDLSKEDIEELSERIKAFSVEVQQAMKRKKNIQQLSKKAAGTVEV